MQKTKAVRKLNWGSVNVDLQKSTLYSRKQYHSCSPHFPALFLVLKLGWADPQPTLGIPIISCGVDLRATNTMLNNLRQLIVRRACLTLRHRDFKTPPPKHAFLYF